MESFLWCEEEMEGSPVQMNRAADQLEVLASPSSSCSSSACTEAGETCGPQNSYGNSGYGVFKVAEGDEEAASEEAVEVELGEELSIAGLLSRQAEFQPGESYAGTLQLKPELCLARSLAAHWIVKAHLAFNFSPVTAALAVNYVDRYLHKSFSLSWKTWMVELLSVSCLSLAAKMEEVEVPAIIDLQSCEGLEHAFEAKTVQRMELNILSALNWRLNSITAFSFVERAINHFRLRHNLKNALMARTSELLLSTFQEAEFLEFEPSLLGVSSICFALEEILPVQAEQLKLSLFQYIPLDTETARRCYVQMESVIVDPICTATTESGSTKSPLSPDVVSYHVDVNQSDGTSSYIIGTNLFLEQIDLEDVVLPPKRQRRC